MVVGKGEPRRYAACAELATTRVDVNGAVAAGLQGSRHGSRANVVHPETKRSYVLRSFVVCEMYGGRMFGKSRRQVAYPACQPALNHTGKTEERSP